MTTALSALDLDEISNGRFILGLGSGVQRLNEAWHNARFGKAVPHLRETVHAIRRIVAEAHLGRTIEIGGEYEPVTLKGYERPFPPTRERIPIYLAAVGELMTKLTGEIADGWLGHELGSPAYTRAQLLPNLDEGLGRAGRERKDLRVIASAVCVIDDDAKQAKRWAAGLVAFYASVRTYQPFFAFHGFEAEAIAIQERFRARDEQGMIDACPDAMVDALAFAGTADDVRAALKGYDGIVDGIKLSPPTHLVPPEITRESQRRILESLQP
jgi:alkanesulfonate monooxygenase SsuD/methylene tetrahydromethanopterin reductase-like flavin-dependent oxidoreductase (luciferase family)